MDMDTIASQIGDEKAISADEKAISADEKAISTDQKVISIAEMREADARTIAGGVPGRVLMGRAARGIFDVVAKGDVPGFKNGWNGLKTVIVCGSGNNGGDGYALASIMAEEGFDVTLVRASEKLSDDGGYYYEKCRAAGVPELDFDGADTDLSDFDVVVDCVLGTGFQGEPRGNAADAIDVINKAKEAGSLVVSCDINSGMNGDTGEAVKAVKSDLTVSIGFLKTGLVRVHNHASELIRALRNVDIGIRL